MSDELRTSLYASLPVLAMLTGGAVALTDRQGRRIRVVDAHGQDIPAMEGKVFAIARRAVREGRPVTGPSELTRGGSVWAFPVGHLILACTDIGTVQQERELQATLREALPALARALGGKVWLFDALGRKLHGSDADGSPSDYLVGSIDGQAYEAVVQRRPVVTSSPTAPGAASVYLPVAANLGLQITRRGLPRLAMATGDGHPAHQSPLAGIIGASPRLQQALQMARIAAQTSAPVLLLGETGTGKALLARALHDLSDRADRPFVVLKCTGLSISAADRLLSDAEPVAAGGVDPGSAAGPGPQTADGSAGGVFGSARGGTLYLDGIGDADPLLQARLLHALEAFTTVPPGGGEPRSYIRLVASAQRSIAELVREERFRRDLYYRLNVFEIEIPPLRDRRDDIPLLLDHFIRMASQRAGKRVEGFTQDLLEVLAAYDWPGNVRELRNCVERAVSLENTGEIDVPHLPAHLRSHNGPGRARHSLKATRSRIELETILKVLDETGQNRAETARRLGISTTTLWRKLNRTNGQKLGNGRHSEVS